MTMYLNKPVGSSASQISLLPPHVCLEDSVAERIGTSNALRATIEFDSWLGGKGNQSKIGMRDRRRPIAS